MTNAVATTSPKPQIMTGGQVAALVPQSLDEAFRVAQAMAVSGLAPRGLEKPEQIMVAIMAGAELGFAPFQSLQSFAVVNGRPTLWGDGLVAVVRRNGCTIREWHDGETAFCEVKRPDTGEVITRSFSQADAAKAGLAGKTGPWQQYPQRMRAMRARAWAVRDGCADMLRGFQVAEEVQDYEVRDVTPRSAPNLAARLSAPIEDDAPTEGFNTVHGANDADETPQAASPVGPAKQAAPVEVSKADAADLFPGDALPAAEEGETAGSAEANADEGTGPAVEPREDPVLLWQRRLLEDMEGLTLEQLDHLLANPSDQEMFGELETAQPQLALDLNKAITARRRELGAR